MDAGSVITGGFAVCVAGYALATLARRSDSHRRLAGVGLGVAVLAIYLWLEGMPPLPPVSSKHKLAYVLSAIPVLDVLLRPQNRRHRLWALAVLATASFCWLIQRPVLAGRFEWHWLLPLATIAAVVGATGLKPTRSRFAWPVTILSASLTASVIALLGGFLGLGQVFLWLSALVGGYALAIFRDVIGGGPARADTLRVMWSPLAGMLILLVQLSTFATNLSLGAYLLLLMLMGLPLADHRVSRLPGAFQPFAFAGAAALAGIPAVLLAVLNF